MRGWLELSFADAFGVGFVSRMCTSGLYFSFLGEGYIDHGGFVPIDSFQCFANNQLACQADASTDSSSTSSGAHRSRPHLERAHHAKHPIKIN